jgi:F0F1-type ATP synthase delta subunit
MPVYFIVAQVVMFAVMVLVLKRILLSDTMNAVSRLREVESEVTKKEESVRRRIEEHEKEFQRKSAEAREALTRDRDTSERELAKIKDAMLGDAKRESDRIIGEAQINKDKLRREIFDEMMTTAIDFSAQVFDLVFSEKTGSALNRQFVDELIEAMEGLDESTVTIEAGEGEVIASHPLETAQRKRMEDVLTRKFGRDFKIAEKVDPKLLAGLIIRLGGLEIDGSLLSRFHEAAAEVKKRKKA